MWALLFFKCLWLLPWVRLYWQQFGEHMASTRNSPSVVSIEASTSSASVNQNAKGLLQKRIRYCIAIRKRFSSFSFQSGISCDWGLSQSVKFCSKFIGLMWLPPKFRKCRFCHLLIREKMEYIWIRSKCALQARQNTAQLVKTHGDTTHINAW